MSSTALTRTPGSAGNRRTWTWSAWIKKSKIAHSSAGTLFGAKDGSYPEIFYFASDDTLVWQHDISGSDYLVTITDRKFRDVSGWLHIVLAKDTTQSTEADRIKIYINGEQQTLTESQLGIPGQNYEGAINNNVNHTIGNWETNSYYFDGSMSHVHFIDGTAYAASAFGSTDASTGEWKINTTPSVTYGSNGFFILKDGNSVTDQSGNSNNFTVASGTLSKTEDNPSNVFATFNSLHNTSATMSNGNLTGQSTNSNYISGVSTLGTKTGKFYAEFKLIAESASGESVIGVTGLVRPTSAIVGQTGNFGIRNNHGLKYYTENGSAYTGSSQHGNFTVNDIIGVALDMDNGRVYFSKNGGWWNGASTWTGTSPSTYVTLQTDIFDEFFFECGDAASGHNATWSANFGNGFFGTTAISSAGTNASNNGIFEYDVPANYTALSTKGLNT